MRNVAKRLITLLSFLGAVPFYLLYRINTLFLDKETAIQGPSQLMSLWPGWFGNYLRKGFYVLSLRRCSPDCTVSFGTIFSTPECEIGRKVYIGAYCVISDSTIGDGTLIGSHVHLISGKHAHGFEASDVPIRLQRTARSEIRIGGNSWIGNGAIVMADVGQGSVVGAGSIVTKEIPDDSVAVGNPAKIIKTRQKKSVPVPAASASDATN